MRPIRVCNVMFPRARSLRVREMLLGTKCPGWDFLKINKRGGFGNKVPLVKFFEDFNKRLFGT